MRRHARAVGILGDVRREPAREPLQGERPAEGVADRLTGRLARDRLVRAAAAEAEVVRAGIAVLGALLPVGAARTGAASRSVVPRAHGRAGGGRAVVGGDAAAVHRDVQAAARRVDVVGAREAVVGAGLAFVDGRLDAAAPVRARVIRPARAEDAEPGVAAHVDRQMPACAGGTGVVGAGEPVVAVERRPGAAPGHASVGRRARVAVVACAAVGARGIGADAARGVAGSGVVTLVERRADDGVPARARTCLAGVRARARAVVVAGRAVRLGRVRACAGRRVARADVVALVLGGAGDGVRAGAGAGLARVGPRARAVVVARRAVRLGRVRARAGRRVARADVVALVLGGAGDGIPVRAALPLSGVGPRARAVVVARRAVRLGWVRAHAGRRVARADVVALVLGSAGDGVRAGARAGLAGIGARAGVAVVAPRAVRLCGVGARAGRRVALPDVVALILGGAGDGIRAGARAGFARIRARAGVAVVPCRTVRRCGVRAHAGRRVARAGVMALILGGAGDRVRAGARACLARVGARAGIAVVAGRAVGLGGFRARARRRVTGARVVALVLGRAQDGCPGYAAAALTRVADRAGVTVRARVAVDLRRVRARAGRRVARPRVVALVERRTRDGRARHAGAGLARVADRAGVVVAAGRPVGLRGVRARAGRGVARPRLVTLVRRAADDRRPRRAAAPLARVADRTGVVVATRTAAWLRGVRAHARRRVARAGVVAFVLCGADDGRSGHAAAALAHVADGTRVIVGARTAAGFGRIGARAGRRVARAGVVALAVRAADDGLPRAAVSGLAHVADGARVAVVAGRPVEHVRSRADARRRVARARVVTLVEGAAHDGRSRHAASREAHVAGRARVAVLARGAVGRQRRRAESRQRIARSGVVALIERSADDRRARRAAPELARVADRAGVAVLARGAADRHRMDACAGRRVAPVVGAGVAVGAVDGRSRDTCARRRVARLDAGAHVAVVAVGVDGAATGHPDRAPGGSRTSSERTCDDDRERETQGGHPLCIPGQCLTTKL